MAAAKLTRRRRRSVSGRRAPGPEPNAPAQSRAGLRQRLFEAAAIVDAVRYASVSSLGEFDGDQLGVALSVAYALIDRVASALERAGGAT